MNEKDKGKSKENGKGGDVKRRQPNKKADRKGPREHGEWEKGGKNEGRRNKEGGDGDNNHK